MEHVQFIYWQSSEWQVLYWKISSKRCKFLNSNSKLIKTIQLLEKARSLVGQIEACPSHNKLKECFFKPGEGGDDLEFELLQRQKMPRMMNKQLVFPEDLDENYWISTEESQIG